MLGKTGTTAAGLPATVPAGLTRDAPDAALINIPLSVDGNFNPTDTTTTFRLQISKTGYTTSYQTFNQIDVDPSLVGTFITDPYNRVSLLPSTLIQAVVDWNAPVDFDYSSQSTDPFPNLAAVLFFPPAIGPASSGAIVGPMDVPAGLSAYIGKYLYGGTLLDPIKICGLANCTWSPYAQYQHDGGLNLGQDANGNYLFSTTEEAISITSGGTATTSPFLKPKYAGNYTLMVTANDASFLQGGDPAALATPIYPIVRVWAKGNLIGSYKLESAGSSCNGTTNKWWNVATISSTTPVEQKTCGNGPNPFFPFPPTP
jgi:hypothetical protein